MFTQCVNRSLNTTLHNAHNAWYDSIQRCFNAFHVWNTTCSNSTFAFQLFTNLAVSFCCVGWETAIRGGFRRFAGAPLLFLRRVFIWCFHLLSVFWYCATWHKAEVLIHWSCGLNAWLMPWSGTDWIIRRRPNGKSGMKHRNCRSFCSLTKTSISELFI